MARQRDFIVGLGHGRFSADLHRGTEVEFLADAGRRLVVRYEPWIFPRGYAATAGHRLYRGTKGEVPWCPDVLIEVLDVDSAGRYGSVYAIAIDAKYAKHVTERHLADVFKYSQIRAVHSAESIVKQVWLALPLECGVVPEDPGIDWTSAGPSVPRTELITGTVGMRPLANAELTSLGTAVIPSAHSFLSGLITYCGLAPRHESRLPDTRAA